MARALITGWSELINDNDTWRQRFTYVLSDRGDRMFLSGEVTVSSQDSAAQVKQAMASAIRTTATNDLGWTVENNEIIFPDASRG